MHRFLARLWRLAAETAPSTQPRRRRADAPHGAELELLRKAHWAIEKVTRELDGRFAFNTAIAAVMELVNECYRAARARSAPGRCASPRATAASLIFPFAPHTGADAYELLTRRARLGGALAGRRSARSSRARTSSSSARSTASVRDRVTAPSGAGEEELTALALAAPNVRAHIEGKEIVKVVVVPGKLVNIVVR